jgi:hypothetical protein
MLLFQTSFLIVVLLTVYIFFMDVHIRPPRPAQNPRTRKERIQSLMSVPLLPTMTFLCVAIPVIQAQTQLMAGIPLQFRITPKKQ